MTGSQTDPRKRYGPPKPNTTAAGRRYIKARDSLRGALNRFGGHATSAPMSIADWSRRGMAMVGLGILADMAHKNNPMGA